jgi:methylated-DNA-[protein]-cysteine S-methyltransferase
MNYFENFYDSPLGRIRLAADGAGNLVGLWFVGQRYDNSRGYEFSSSCGAASDVFEPARRWLDDYFAGRNPSTAGLNLRPEGSEFRRRVWNILREIPYGRTTTYGRIARRIADATGAKPCAQAVGGAVGHNPISLIVPCHRVVGADGSLTGYGGGIERKVALLRLEGVDMTPLRLKDAGRACFYVPARK